MLCYNTQRTMCIVQPQRTLSTVLLDTVYCNTVFPEPYNDDHCNNGADIAHSSFCIVGTALKQGQIVIDERAVTGTVKPFKKTICVRGPPVFYGPPFLWCLVCSPSSSILYSSSVLVRRTLQEHTNHFTAEKNWSVPLAETSWCLCSLDSCGIWSLNKQFQK